MIIRRKVQHGFTVMPRAAFEDKRLSYEARGVLGYILVKPDNWRVHVTDLARNAGGPKGCGRDRIYRILDELKAAGYMTSEQTKAETGRFAHTEYVIVDAPGMAVQPDTENPYTVLPDTENPDAYKELIPTKDESVPRTKDTPVGADATDASARGASQSRRDERIALGMLIAADCGMDPDSVLVTTGKAAGSLKAEVGQVVGAVCKAGGGSYAAGGMLWEHFRASVPDAEWERFGSLGVVKTRFARWTGNGGAPTVAAVCKAFSGGEA